MILVAVNHVYPFLNFNNKEDNRNPHSFRAFAELNEFSFQTDSATKRKEAIEAVKKYLDNRQITVSLCGRKWK
jgi:hypothetical protein